MFVLMAVILSDWTDTVMQSSMKVCAIVLYVFPWYQFTSPG